MNIKYDNDNRGKFINNQRGGYQNNFQSHQGQFQPHENQNFQRPPFIPHQNQQFYGQNQYHQPTNFNQTQSN
jgi:hypothetical protein